MQVFKSRKFEFQDALFDNTTRLTPDFLFEIYQKISQAESPKPLQDFISNNQSFLASVLEAEDERFDIAFMDKDFKVLRVLSEVIKRLAISSFASLLLKSHSDISESNKDLYLELSQYQRFRAYGMFYNWCLFGEEIVDFSFNALPRFIENVSIENLEQLYGKEELCRWMNLSTDKMFIDKTGVADILKRNMGEGRCLGMSLDFAASYFEYKRDFPGLSTLEIIKIIAPKFRRGASNRAELAQICQFLIRYKPVQEDPSIWNIPAPSHLEKTKLRLQDIYDFSARGMNLSIKESILQSDEVDLECFNDFPPNAYIFRIGFKEGEGHSIFILKTEEDKSYIFDSNIGVLAVNQEEFFSRCKQILQEYKESGGCLTDVYPCAPNY